MFEWEIERAEESINEEDSFNETVSWSVFVIIFRKRIYLGDFIRVKKEELRQEQQKEKAKDMLNEDIIMVKNEAIDGFS